MGQNVGWNEPSWSHQSTVSFLPRVCAFSLALKKPLPRWACAELRSRTSLGAASLALSLQDTQLPKARTSHAPSGAALGDAPRLQGCPPLLAPGRGMSPIPPCPTLCRIQPCPGCSQPVCLCFLRRVFKKTSPNTKVSPWAQRWDLYKPSDAMSGADVLMTGLMRPTTPPRA